MPDDVFICGESGGGKAKSEIMGIGLWRLAGWKFERWRDPICLLIVGKKNEYFDIEKWWYGVVQWFVHMYRHFGGVVLLYVERGFVLYLVLNLEGS